MTGLPIIRGPDAARSSVLQRRPLQDTAVPPAFAQRLGDLFGRAVSAEEAVREIIAAVRREGDAALRRMTQALDGYAPEAAGPDAWRVSPAEFEAAEAAAAAETVAALQVAAARVRRFHERQLQHAAASFHEDGLGQIVRPLRRVGLYVPGTAVAYPSSVLHTAIPAAVAGVEEVCIASPTSPGAEGQPPGSVSPLKLVAARIAGVETVYKIGGAQAIAALAYGTESIPAVDKIIGPGNLFVTLAKRQVFGDVGIDAIYGPTETIVVADDSADPALCAADLLAQAEHDVLACPLLITCSERVATAVAELVPAQAVDLERGEIALAAFRNRGGVVLVEDLETALQLANDFAPEHLALQVEDAARHVEAVTNAGGLFVGERSPEALADYVAGPSHVMPTGGSARFSSPLGVTDFLKITTVVDVSDDQLQELAPVAARIARAEGLTAHARSLDLRRADR